MKEQDGFSAINEIKGWTLKKKIKERKKKNHKFDIKISLPKESKG